jgi:release factor glutamine methyltransferase
MKDKKQKVICDNLCSSVDRPSLPTLQSSSLLRDILAAAIDRLTTAGCDTPRLDAEVLLAHVLGQDRTWLYAHPQVSLDEDQLNRFAALLYRREQREPVAYLIGSKEFYGLEFAVNPHVLIPRPETELLVETALRILDFALRASGGFPILDGKSKIENPRPSDGQSKIVDVGTGSGCIAIALAKHFPKACVVAMDVSPEALSLAGQNARCHGVADRITFLLGDLLQPLTEPVDLIVSNPPYVSHPELAVAMPEVSRYEPRLALDGGEDGLEVIRRLLPQVREKLKPGGSLLIEIGSTQGFAVSKIAQKCISQADVRIEQDLAGLDRLLVVQL